MSSTPAGDGPLTRAAPKACLTTPGASWAVAAGRLPGSGACGTMQLWLSCDGGGRMCEMEGRGQGHPWVPQRPFLLKNLGGGRKILCVFSKLEPIITKRLDNYSQLRLSPGLWCPNSALGREQAVTVWVFEEAMKVEAVPRRKTGRAHTPGPACSMINLLGPNLY